MAWKLGNRVWVIGCGSVGSFPVGYKACEGVILVPATDSDAATIYVFKSDNNPWVRRASDIFATLKEATDASVAKSIANAIDIRQIMTVQPMKTPRDEQAEIPWRYADG